MKLKEAASCIGVTIAAIALMAPAAAQAEWTHNHQSISEPMWMDLKGPLVWQVAGVGSFGCYVHTAVKLNPDSTGTVVDFELTTESCVGTGALEHCEVVHDTSEFGIAKATTGSTPYISLADVTILLVFEAHSCFFPAIPGMHLEADEIKLSPDPSGSHTTLNGLTVSGVDKTVGAVFGGTLTVTPEETFGLST